MFNKLYVENVFSGHFQAAVNDPNPFIRSQQAMSFNNAGFPMNPIQQNQPYGGKKLFFCFQPLKYSFEETKGKWNSMFLFFDRSKIWINKSDWFLQATLFFIIHLTPSDLFWLATQQLRRQQHLLIWHHRSVKIPNDKLTTKSKKKVRRKMSSFRKCNFYFSR